MCLFHGWNVLVSVDCGYKYSDWLVAFDSAAHDVPSTRKLIIQVVFREKSSLSVLLKTTSRSDSLQKQEENCRCFGKLIIWIHNILHHKNERVRAEILQHSNIWTLRIELKTMIYPPFTPTNFRFFLAPLFPCLSATPFFFIIDLRPVEKKGKEREKDKYVKETRAKVIVCIQKININYQFSYFHNSGRDPRNMFTETVRGYFYFFKERLIWVWVPLWHKYSSSREFTAIEHEEHSHD